MNSLEKITDSLLHSKAVQNTNHEHLQFQIQFRESSRNSALMNLKLLVGDVQRRVQDMEDVGDRVHRLDDQLHQNKLKLSALLLLLLKEQKRFDVLHRTVMYSDSCWASFPHQLTQVWSALQERLNLIKNVKHLLFLLSKAKHYFIVLWHLTRLQSMAEEEITLQKKEFNSFLYDMDIEIRATEQEKNLMERSMALLSEESAALLTEIHLSQRRKLTLEARTTFFEAVVKKELQEREAILFKCSATVKLLFGRFHDEKESVMEHLEVSRTKLLFVQANKQKMEEDSATQVVEHAARMRNRLAMKERLVDERLASLESSKQSCQRCLPLVRQSNTCVRLIFTVLSIVQFVRQHFEMRQKILRTQEYESIDLKQVFANLQAQREALLVVQRMQETRSRVYAQASAAIFAEECLLRRGMEQEFLSTLKGVEEKEEADRKKEQAKPKLVEMVEVASLVEPKNRIHGLQQARALPALSGSTSAAVVVATEVAKEDKKGPRPSSLDWIKSSCRRMPSVSSSEGELLHCSPMDSSRREEEQQDNQKKSSENPRTHPLWRAFPSSLLRTTKNVTPAPFIDSSAHGDSTVVQNSIGGLLNRPLDDSLKKTSKKQCIFQRPLPCPLPPAISPTFIHLGLNPSNTKKKGTVLNACSQRTQKKKMNQRQVPHVDSEQDSPLPRQPQNFAKRDNRVASVGGPGLSEISALTFALRQQRFAHGAEDFGASTTRRRPKSGSRTAVIPLCGTSFPLESLKKGDDLFADLF